MITFSEAQIMAWLSPILWPFLRVLALFSVAPVFSMRVIPMRVKIGLAFLVALCAQGVLGDQPVISVNGREALGAVAQQWGVGKVMLLPALGSIMVCVLVLLIWLETRLTRAERE